jgi:hypothetical protein
MSFCIVGITETCERLAVCLTPDAASEYIGSLPHAEKGIYYIDECESTVILTEGSNT